MSGATMDMTEGKPLRLIVSFALPLLLSHIFQQLYNVIDSVVVGRLIGVNAFAAVGATSPFYWLVVSVVLGFTQGFGILFAQRFGAKDDAGLRRAVAQSILLSGALGAAMTVLCLLLIRPVLMLLNTPAEILADACVYLNWVLSAVPLCFAYNTTAAILRALGNSRTPLVAIILASIANIALDLFFVGVLRMGIEGVAAATVIAMLCSLMYSLYMLRRVTPVRVQKTDFTDSDHTLGKLMRLGTPLALRNAVIGMGGLTIQYVVNGYGKLFVAGVAAAGKYFGVMNLLGSSMDGALAVFVGQNFGAARLDRIKEGVRTALRIVIFSAIVIAVLTVVFGRGMIGLFITADPAEMGMIKQIGYNNLLAISFCLPALYLLYISRSALQGMGNSVIPLLSGFMELALRMLCVLILPARIGVWGIYFADGVGWIGASILLYCSYCVVYRRSLKSAFVRPA